MTETVLRTGAEKRRFTIDMRALAPFIALIVLVIAGALINPDFLTASNLLNVVTRSAFIAIIAVGATFVIAGGGLDLSVGSMAALTAGVMILTLNNLGGGDLGTLAIGMRLAKVLAPRWLRIGGYWYPRGGMPIDVFWQTGQPPKGLWLPDPGVQPYRGRG